MDDIAAAIRQCASKGILVDTNIMLLYAVGSFDLDLVPRFKRTKQFRVVDFELLVQLLAQFHRQLTTPSIMTEVSNHVSQLREPARSGCFARLADEIATLDERYVPSEVIAKEETFAQIGLTDAGIQRVAHDGLLVLSDDYRLTNRLVSRGMTALNFNHLRSFA